MNIIFIIKIDIHKLESDLKKLSSWKDWDRIQKEIFHSDEWPETSIDRLEEDLERPVQIIEGCEWESTTASYDVSPEIMHLYEKTRQKVFSILEPEADEENKQHLELYGKRCIYCRIWTRDFSKQKCPKCGNELLEFPLNEWD
ncbi:NOB1 family endonuclease [Paenibacillus ehimensis]|uniref:NOB1 family endonuclease n=1 Tax=Paenibacillus ehimensis TaxID=79264 RepID=UPI0020A669A2|nr:NOB1 family endonuclease [Paenibacillus ehimensis]MEC0207379.1 NOB1 family endonuclease [Paenibacillus ehimensis]